MNITAKSTHIMILHICKLIEDNVEEYMNGTNDKIFLYFANNELFYYD